MAVERRLWPVINTALEEAEFALKLLQQAVDDAQKGCKHERVAETPWKDGYFGCQNARRICLACGLEEEGSHWSGGSTWSVDGNIPKLGNVSGRDILHVETRDQFWNLRIPYVKI